MVHITERAREHLKMALDEVLEAPESVLRLGQTPLGGLGVFPDTEQEGDHVVEHDGVVVLLISPEISEALAGRVIDVEETDEGARFVLRH